MNKKVLLITNLALLPQATVDRFIPTDTAAPVELALILANHRTEILCVEKDVQNRIKSQYKREITLKDIKSDFFGCTVLCINLKVGAASIAEHFELPPNPALAAA